MEGLRLLKHLVAKTDATTSSAAAAHRAFSSLDTFFLQTDTFSFRFGFQFVTALLPNTNMKHWAVLTSTRTSQMKFVAARFAPCVKRHLILSEIKLFDYIVFGVNSGAPNVSTLQQGEEACFGIFLSTINNMASLEKKCTFVKEKK